MGATKWSVIAVLLLVSSPTDISATVSTSGSGDALTSASGSGVPSGSGLSASGSGFSGASGSGLSGSTSGSTSGSAFSGGVRDSGSGSGLSASGSGFSGASGSGLSGSTSGSASGSAFSGGVRDSGSGSGLSASGSGFSGASGSGLSGSSSASGSAFSGSTSGSASGSGLSASGSGFSGASGSGLSGSTSGSASGSGFSGSAGLSGSGSGSGSAFSGSTSGSGSGSGLSGSTSSSASGSAFSGSSSGSGRGSGFSGSAGLSGSGSGSGSAFSGSTSGSGSGSGLSGSTSSSASGSAFSGSTSGSASGSGFSGSAGLSGSGSGSAFSGSISGSGSGSAFSGSTSGSASGSGFSGSAGLSGSASGSGLSGSTSGSGSAFSGSSSGSASGSGFSGSAGLSGSASGSGLSGSTSGSGSAFSGSSSASASGSGFSGSAGLSGSASGSTFSGSTSSSGSGSASGSGSSSGSGQSGNVSSGSGPFLPGVAPTVAPIPPTVVVLSLSTAATLTCSASGIPVPLITWTVAGSEIVEDGRIDISLSFDSDNSSVIVSQLVIQELAFEDRGTYTCTATNTGGSDATTADLIVVVPPSLSIVGAPQAALTEGDTLQLVCLGSGSWPSPVLSWSVDDSLVLESDGRINISSGALETERGLFFALSMLTIASVVLSDSGVYGCSGRVTVPQLAQPIPPSLADPVAISVQARNECIISTGPLRTPCVNGYCVDLIDAYACICFNGFEGVNCTDPVIVVIPPVIIEGPVNETYQLGQPVTVACQVSGNELQFEWFRDDQLLENETLPFLVIASVQPADRGNYVCAVSNEAGIARSFPGLLLLEGVREYAARFALPLQRKRRQRRQEGDQTQALATLAADLTGVSVLPGSNITITSATVQMESPPASEAILILTILSQAEGGAYPEGGVSGALVSVVTPVADELGFTLLAIERQDGCPLDEDGLYTWPESELAELLALSCPCGALDTLLTINIEATRVCGGSFSAGVEWLAPDTAACQFDAIARSLCETTTLPTVEMSEAIVEALTATANTTVEPVDVSIASEIIFEIIEDTLFLDQTGDNVLTAIDQLLETDASVFRQSQEDTRATTRLLDGIETLSDSINLGEDNSTTFIRNTFSLLIEEQDIASFTGAVFNAIVGQETTVLSTSSTSEDQTTESSASLSIPQSLLDEIAQQFETLSVRFTYAVFNDDTLFQRPEENFENLTLGSIIISAALTNVTVANLATNIVVNFTKNEDAIRNGTLNEVCAFWDPELFDGFGGFSTDGCRMAMNTSNFTLCECDHLTSFALLLDVSPELVSPPLALEVITYVGLIFSILCLVLTILTYLISPKLRRLETGITLVHMCFALLGLYIAFIISGQALPLPDAACGFFAALLQFFMLAYFFWTAAEALLLYFKLVRVFSTASFNKKLLIAFHIVCWVTPVLIVGASLGGYQFYFNDTFCRPTSWPFWFGFVAPFLCILLFNWVIFILIMVALCRHANQSEKKDRKSAVLRQLFIAMVLSLLFGLGWVFGLLASHDLPAAVHVPSQYIFSIFVGLQGVLIFILHAVRSADARNEWKRWWYTLTCRSEKYRLVRRRTLASSQTPAASNATLRKANPPVTDDSSVPQTTPWEETVELSDFHLAKAEESLIAPAEESDADDAVALKDFHDADYVAMKEPEKMVESSVTVVVNVRATREQGKAGEQSEDFPEKLE